MQSITRTIKMSLDEETATNQYEGTVSAPLGTMENPSNQILTAANAITFVRFLLTCCFLFIFISGENRILALVLYAIAATTDFLDGLVARSTNSVSWVGKVMDPIMDRFLLFTGVLALMVTGEVPVWVAVFVVGRDVYLAIGALYLQRYRKRPVDVIFIGKVATALLMFGFTLMLLGWPQINGFGLVDASWLPGFNSEAVCIGIYFIYAGICFSVATAIEYTIQALKIRKAALLNKED